MTKQLKLIIYIILLTAIDYIATYIGIESGFSIEVNPLACFIFEKSMILGWSVLIGTQTILLLILSKNIEKYSWLYRACIFLAGFKTAVVVQQFYILLALFTNKI